MNSRFRFVVFSERAKIHDNHITAQAQAFENALEERLPASREKALALTKLEEAVMWARKALREVGE